MMQNLSQTEQKRAVRLRLRSGFYQYRWWHFDQNGDRYAAKIPPKATVRKTPDLIRTTYLNPNGLETAFGIAFDFDAHRAEERWKDENGALSWPRISKMLAADHGKILSQISHVVRSSGGKGLGILLAINPLPLQESTVRNQRAILNLQSRLIEFFQSFGLGADPGARGIAREMPNFKDPSHLVMENRLALRRAERASVGVASELHSYLNELEKSAKPKTRLYNDARAEPGLAKLFGWLIGSYEPTEAKGLAKVSYVSSESAMATMKDLRAITGLSERFLRRCLKNPPQWLKVEYINRKEGWRLWVPLGKNFEEFMSRFDEIFSKVKSNVKMSGLSSSARLKQPEFVEDGERNAWITSLALIYKWHGFSRDEAQKKILLRIRFIPGHAMSRNCRQARLIVNAIYRNIPEMKCIAVGLPLPDWIDKDSGFQPAILNQTGTITSRRGVAPEYFNAEVRTPVTTKQAGSARVPFFDG